MYQRKSKNPVSVKLLYYCDQILRKSNEKEMDLFCSQLQPIVIGRVWQSRVVHFMVARKKRKEKKGHTKVCIAPKAEPPVTYFLP
jgi:hypothetical protein